MSKKPKGTRRALRLIRRGKVTHHPRKGSYLPHFTVEGRQFHPVQAPFSWAVSRGYASVDGGSVSLTPEGKKLLDELS